MAKFNPLEFDYELHDNYASDSEDVIHYQKFKIMEPPVFLDILELVFYKKLNTWALFIKSENMRQFVPGIEFPDGDIYSLFMGEIKSDFDFRFIMAKICKDPNVIAQMGC